MHITINQVNAELSVTTFQQDPDSPPKSLILIIKIECPNGSKPPLANTIDLALRQVFRGIQMDQVAKNNQFEMQVLDCQTELKAIDLLRSHGLGVTQRSIRELTDSEHAI